MRRRARVGSAYVFSALLLGAAACSGGKVADSLGSVRSSTEEVVPGKTEFGPDDDDEIIRKAVDDVEAFFVDEFPSVYAERFPPLRGGLFPYGPDDPPPECGGIGEADYGDVAQNAFYCPPDDFMAWDTDNLTNDLLDNFGQFTLAIVVAHELGHAAQQRHGILDGEFITFVTEQQADCFAGAFTKHVQDGESENFTVSPADLDNAIGGFLLIRDPIGTDSVNDTNAHGSAFQRINAFEDGLEGGMARCKTYEDLAINFVPEVFDPGSLDEARLGNLPFADVEPLVIANLEGFWTVAFEVIAERNGDRWTSATVNAFDPEDGVSCGNRTLQGDDAVGVAFYCAADDTVNWDERRLMPAVYRLGDLAMSVIIANQYSARAQRLAGLPTGTLEAELQADCFTGVWVATTKTNEVNDTLPPEARIELSPGDLDEAVSAFLEFNKSSEEESSDPVEGSAFDHLAAFRTGFFAAFNEGLVSGLRGC